MTDVDRNVIDAVEALAVISAAMRHPCPRRASVAADAPDGLRASLDAALDRLAPFRTVVRVCRPCGVSLSATALAPFMGFDVLPNRGGRPGWAIAWDEAMAEVGEGAERTP